jgi:hypothetical protein
MGNTWARPAGCTFCQVGLREANTLPSEVGVPEARPVGFVRAQLKEIERLQPRFGGVTDPLADLPSSPFPTGITGKLLPPDHPLSASVCTVPFSVGLPSAGLAVAVWYSSMRQVYGITVSAGPVFRMRSTVRLSSSSSPLTMAARESRVPDLSEVGRGLETSLPKGGICDKNGSLGVFPPQH